MPVYVAIVLGAIAGCAAFFFLEIAIVVPGSLFWGFVVGSFQFGLASQS